MQYFFFATVLPALYAGSLVMAEKTSNLALAVSGGVMVGVLEGLFRTGRLFPQLEQPSRVIKIFILILSLAAVLLLVATGISFAILLAYAIPWGLSFYAVFVWDEYQSGT